MTTGRELMIRESDGGEAMGQGEGLRERRDGGCNRRVMAGRQLGWGQQHGDGKGDQPVRETNKKGANGAEGLLAGQDLVISKTLTITVPNSVKTFSLTMTLSFHER